VSYHDTHLQYRYIAVSICIANHYFLEVPPPDYPSAPPPSNPGYGIAPTAATTGYNTGVLPSYTDQYYPSTYHPQYSVTNETHVVMTQVCVCAWVRACVRARARVCVCVCVCVCVFACTVDVLIQYIVSDVSQYSGILFNA